jgi:hypothetical protein
MALILESYDTFVNAGKEVWAAPSTKKDGRKITVITVQKNKNGGIAYV